ncbi:MAG: hypothetical protein GVY33_04475 [Alphaproteobacteria bacterium]|jgi:hypothetical protein|nr:hypothetical protein [Alphaproteobacteria bacterium]
MAYSQERRAGVLVKMLPPSRMTIAALSRPYRKNDQAHIEPKNGAVVRRMVGYCRLEGLAAAEASARLYRPMRLFVNVFQPSFRLVEKRREGGLVRKRYDKPATPHQRLIADPRTPEAVKAAVAARHGELDPVRPPAEIRAPGERWSTWRTGRRRRRRARCR